VAFACNQFGLQENFNNDEILNLLKYIRPGHGFEPNFPISRKISVNGDNAHPLYKWLREKAPIAQEEGSTWVINESPKELATTKWNSGEIRWNFEKFLVDRSGTQVKRYPPLKLPLELSGDIEVLLGTETSK